MEERRKNRSIAKLSHKARGPQPSKVIQGQSTVRIDTHRCLLVTDHFGEFTAGHLSSGTIVMRPA